MFAYRNGHSKHRNRLLPHLYPTCFLFSCDFSNIYRFQVTRARVRSKTPENQSGFCSPRTRVPESESLLEDLDAKKCILRIRLRLCCNDFWLREHSGADHSSDHFSHRGQWFGSIRLHCSTDIQFSLSLLPIVARRSTLDSILRTRDLRIEY